MAVTVVLRSESGAFRDTTVVYLDGRIDGGVPARLSQRLQGVAGRIAIRPRLTESARVVPPGTTRDNFLKPCLPAKVRKAAASSAGRTTITS